MQSEALTLLFKKKSLLNTSKESQKTFIIIKDKNNTEEWNDIQSDYIPLEQELLRLDVLHKKISVKRDLAYKKIRELEENKNSINFLIQKNIYNIDDINNFILQIKSEVPTKNQNGFFETHLPLILKDISSSCELWQDNSEFTTGTSLRKIVNRLISALIISIFIAYITCGFFYYYEKNNNEREMK